VFVGAQHPDPTQDDLSFVFTKVRNAAYQGRILCKPFFLLLDSLPF
jgi:hypothetical protein